MGVNRQQKRTKRAFRLSEGDIADNHFLCSDFKAEEVFGVVVADIFHYLAESIEL